MAPESPGDFFDGTEIDEMLALRIQTLTDAEKRQMAAGDPRTRALLDRVEGLTGPGLARLHGAVRDPRPGDRVRLRPSGRADAFDLLLAGKAATVASVETDFEGRSYVTVTVDDDPGRDPGAIGMPGHRFFFRPAWRRWGMTVSRRILVAGSATFRGDDGFGSEVVRRLVGRELRRVRHRPGPRPRSGFTRCSTGMMRFLVDATAAWPRYLYTLSRCPTTSWRPGRNARGRPAGRVPIVWVMADAPAARLVGCEPATWARRRGAFGLSRPVAAAVDPAIELVEATIADMCRA